MLFKEIAALVIFCLVIAFTILLVLIPVTVKIPRWTKLPVKRLTISYAVVPVAGVILMLCTGSLNGPTLAKGIVGDPNLKPYGIVILFLALAYISTSLDSTGCLAWLALHMTRLSKGNGMALFMLYFGLSSLITVFTSNDVCIMTLTPIIYYFAVATSVDPIPFLTAEFTAANIWSMLLFVGNPTNIIVAMAYQMSFADYSRWMALPTLGAGLSCLAALLLVHYRSIPKRLTLPELQPALMLVDKPGAVLGSINIVACLAFLAAAPALGWELWLVTLVCAGLHAIYNFVAYVVFKGRWCAQPQQQQQRQVEDAVADSAAAEAGCVVAGDMPVSSSSSIQLVEGSVRQRQQQQQQQQGSAYDPASRSLAALPSEQPTASAAAAGDSCKDASSDASHQEVDIEVTIDPTQIFNPLQQLPATRYPGDSSSASSNGAAVAVVVDGSGHKSIQELLQVKQPTFWHVWSVLPWEVIPFVLGMFILVEGLNATGWVDRIALWLASAIHGNIWAALFSIGAFSVLLANLANNQPMTILMTRVTMSPLFTAAATASGVMVTRVPQAAALAVVIASNVAANYTVMGALAGIMFVNILQRKGLKGVNYVTFSRLMLPAGVMSTVVALVVLGAEYVTW